MRQKDIACVEIKYYSPRRSSIGFMSTSESEDKRNIQLLLLSVLNFVNVLHTFKSESKAIIEEVEIINSNLRVTLENSGNEMAEFLSSNEIVEEQSAEVKEIINIKLTRKDKSIYLESDSSSEVNPFYRYSSIRLLFQAILDLEDKEIIKVLWESLDYIFDYYKSAAEPTELKSLIELSQYFSELFAEFLV